MRIDLRRATTLGLAAALLCAVCVLPGAAAVTTADDEAAPSWGSQLIERLIDSVAGWLGVEGDTGSGDDGGIVLDGGLDDPSSNSSECPPNNPNCEGGPDWDPNG